jgi:hypothetical protein
MPHVFLNPDGSQELGLLVVVEASTGVTYAQQCAGYLTELRVVEGFLIPVGGPAAAKKICDWFWSTFKGNCYHTQANNPWTAETVAQLGAIVREIRCWYTERSGEDRPEVLQLDTTRIQECVEAWIPVVTPYGPGILTLENSD